MLRASQSFPSCGPLLLNLRRQVPHRCVLPSFWPHDPAWPRPTWLGYTYRRLHYGVPRTEMSRIR